MIWDRKKQATSSPQNSAYSSEQCRHMSSLRSNLLDGYSSSTDNTTSATIGSASTETMTSSLSCPPALAIFSPFGAQWWSSFEDADVGGASHEEFYACMDWGPEGVLLDMV